MAKNRIGFGSDIVLVNSKIGIGTTNPQSKLDISGNVNISGIATAHIFSGTLQGYATESGISTNVIGGIASVTTLNVSGISTVGFLTGTDAFYSGIVTATKFLGDGSGLSGIVTNTTNFGVIVAATYNMLMP